MNGWVYLLVDAVEGAIKLGGTKTHPELRRYQCARTHDTPLEICFMMQHDEFRKVERLAGRELAPHRIKTWGREWYRIAPDRAIEAVKRYAS